jgi:uncharacterized protein (DUF779 family)
MATRVDATPAAVELLDRLIERHGPLLFHQSGGCCDGSAPMCYPQQEFRIGQTDVYLGAIGPGATPFYIGGAQYEYWKHTRLTVDVVAGRGSGFSVEAPEGVRFVIRSRLFTDDEALALDASGPAPTGPRFDPGLRLSPQGRPDQG